jgi:hypothetical protein
MLSNIFLPHLIDVTIEEKLSSNKIIPEASLEIPQYQQYPLQIRHQPSLVQEHLNFIGE